MINAVLDACILYPAPLRNFLLHLANEEVFCPFWSGEIHDEWTRSLLRKEQSFNYLIEFFFGVMV